MTQPDSRSNMENAQSAVPKQQPTDPQLDECVTQLKAARQEANEFKNRYLHLAAETDNARKQAERAAASQAQQDKRRFLQGFLEVADSLERALALPGDTAGLYQGVKLAYNQLQQSLARSGVVRIPVKAGDTFDPVYHEALEVRQGDAPQDTVVEVVRSGYLHDDTLLRPAQVIVARGQS
jgi:molecular chaperone GrpE